MQRISTLMMPPAFSLCALDVAFALRTDNRGRCGWWRWRGHATCEGPAAVGADTRTKFKPSTTTLGNFLADDLQKSYLALVLAGHGTITLSPRSTFQLILFEKHGREGFS